MSVRFTCPHCHAETLVEREFLGRQGPCRNCGRRVVIQADSAAPSSEPAAQLQTAFQGGCWGCSVVGATTVAFLMLPAFRGILAAAIIVIRNDPNAGPASEFLLANAVWLALSCLGGMIGSPGMSYVVALLLIDCLLLGFGAFQIAQPLTSKTINETLLAAWAAVGAASATLLLTFAFFREWAVVFGIGTALLICFAGLLSGTVRISD